MALRIKDTLAQIFHPPAEDSAPPPERRASPRTPAFQTVLVEWEDLEKGYQAFAGRLENRSEKGLGIRGSRLLPRGKTILVSIEEERTVKAVVRRCTSGDGGFYLAAEVIPVDKRRSDREPMYCTARISCTRDARRDLPVIIRDASEDGIQVESHEPLSIAEVIEVSHLGSFREGRITYCRQDGDSYRMGVQFVGPAWHEGYRILTGYSDLG